MHEALDRHSMSRIVVCLLFAAATVGCQNAKPSASDTGAAANAAETASPADAPLHYKVLADTYDSKTSSVEYHVLIGEAKHDAVDDLLKYIYKHLMQRKDDPPVGLSAYVYNSEAQYQTPPRTPVASVVQRPGDVGPAFDNKIPLEFWQQIDQAIGHSDKGWKLEKQLQRDDAKKSLQYTVNYTEPGKDAWADHLSYNLALNEFTDAARNLFEKVPELASLTFIGRWKDETVVQITLDRATYQQLNIPDIEEQIGQLHGRAFLELATNHGSDAQVAKNNSARLAGVYKKMLAALKGQAKISPKLK